MEAVAIVSEYEAERGKPMPSFNHGRVQAYLIGELLRYKDQYVPLSELSLILGGKKFVPDICILPQRETDWEHDQIHVTEAPLLVIEILSPTQSLTDLFEKAEAYFAAGVPSYWLVLPVLKTIAILTPNQKPKYFTEGTIRDAGTGVEVQIEAIFH